MNKKLIPILLLSILFLGIVYNPIITKADSGFDASYDSGSSSSGGSSSSWSHSDNNSHYGIEPSTYTKEELTAIMTKQITFLLKILFNVLSNVFAIGFCFYITERKLNKKIKNILQTILISIYLFIIFKFLGIGYFINSIILSIILFSIIKKCNKNNKEIPKLANIPINNLENTKNDNLNQIPSNEEIFEIYKNKIIKKQNIKDLTYIGNYVIYKDSDIKPTTFLTILTIEYMNTKKQKYRYTYKLTFIYQNNNWSISNEQLIRKNISK